MTVLHSRVTVGMGGGADCRCEIQVPKLDDRLRGMRKRGSRRTHLAVPSLKCRSRRRGLPNSRCLLDGHVEMPRQYSSLRESGLERKVWQARQQLEGDI